MAKAVANNVNPALATGTGPNGRIIERGSHDELIAQKGEYYQLYTGAVELE